MLTSTTAAYADLAGQIATATSAAKRIARWADLIAAAATKHASPELGLTPLDLALDVCGIMSRETGGLNTRGDGGHGRGLMQIDDRSHGAWLAAHAEGMDPESNINEGTAIYVDGLVVIANHETAAGRQRTAEELRRFAMSAYNCGVHRVCEQLDAGRDPDEHTTPGPSGRPDYGRDTWRRREAFAAALGGPGVCA